ncbi:unnamed protein product [Oikopleura dioica]|uniref:Phosphoinositide phospholipase C n=1 Tax=Oikopleura dioica TaxID=34765 RepID=E4YKM3_OIKDI|nr:unnamed protein product [Oikopleura dioica]
MYTGGQLVKVRSASRVYRRFYWLDEEKGELRWEPSKKDSDKARVRLSDIHEVRSGKNSEVFLSVDAAEHFPNECAFSIVYGEEYITLDLVASTTEEANIWCTGLRHLISGLATSASPGDTAREAREKWLSDMFSAADVNSDGFMDENESIQLIKSLSDGVRDNVIKTKLREYLKSIKTGPETDQPVGLTQPHFIELFKDVATRAEVYFILVRYASHEDAMSVDDLRSFLEIEQGINASPEMCLTIVAECEPSAQLREKRMLGIDGFTRYLTCDKCALFNPKKRTPTQDMNRPFSHYFISASHNTYLIQDQLSGRTSLSCFQTVLEKGCRCVSFDVWSFVDNNNEKNLMVHHPRNNRQQAVLGIIHEHAFSSSDFPLILVIRVRATESGQLYLAEQLHEYLGDSLCTAEQINTTVANLTPEKLKNKILLELSGRSQDDLNLSHRDQLANSFINYITYSFAHRLTNAMQVRETPLIPRLAKMCFFKTNIVTGIPQKKTELELSVMPETVASRVATNNAEALVEAGSTQIIRVEPNDSRVDCSNYNPLDVWNMGVQMAALHFQGQYKI